MHRINVKLGGINAILDPASVRFLTDPVKPTVVMGILFQPLALCTRLTGLSQVPMLFTLRLALRADHQLRQ